MIPPIPPGTRDVPVESQCSLGMMRIATKHPPIAERYFESTGRQIELVEARLREEVRR